MPFVSVRGCETASSNNRPTAKWESNVKLVAWNVGHQIRERPIPELFHRVVKRLSPDILTLTEYVHGSTRQVLVESLSASGLAYCDVSAPQERENQVLLASRHCFQRGDLKGPEIVDGGATNFLHAVFADLKIEVV